MPKAEKIARDVMSRSTVHGNHVHIPQDLNHQMTGFSLDKLAENIVTAIDQARAEGRREGLEEAARVCDERVDYCREYDNPCGAEVLSDVAEVFRDIIRIDGGSP